jgi:sugar-specific transcriptional regulator TrmB
MIVKEDFLNKLRHIFNLNLYEVRIWTALLSRGVSTAGELSNIGNVPRSRAYDILESLEKKGFVIMKLGKPIKYLAVNPSEVVERVKKNVRVDAEEMVSKLEEMKGGDLLKELTLLHKQGIDFIEPTDLSGAIRGRHNLYSHLDLMVKNAQKNVTIMTTSKGFLRKVEALKGSFEKLKKRGVKVRIAAPITKESLAVAKNLSKIADVRTSNKLNGRFCIVDGKEMVFMVMHDDNVHPSYDIGIWVNTPFFANTMDNMFDLAWKDMAPVSEIKQ